MASASDARVVLVHDYLTQRGGAERVVLALTKAFPDAPLLTSVYAPDQTFPEFRQVDVRTSNLQRVSTFRQDPRRAFPLLSRTFARQVIEDADVVVCSSSGWSHAVQTNAVKVVYCHNPARWLYQPDDYFAAVAPLPRRALQSGLRPLHRADRRWAATADHYIANSSTVQRRIADTYGRHAAVVHPPPGLTPDGPEQPVAGLRPGFLLVVGRPRAYKNADLVERTVAGLPDERLVMVGGAATEQSDESGRVHRLSGIPDSQLRWLYANCAAVVAVSREDFGLSPVEGYLFGKPTVALRHGGYLDTVVEGVTGVFVDELSESALRRALVEVKRRRFPPSVIAWHGRRFDLAAFCDRMRQEVTAALDRRAVDERAVR